MAEGNSTSSAPISARHHQEYSDNNNGDAARNEGFCAGRPSTTDAAAYGIALSMRGGYDRTNES
eukprot:5966789-Pleurochrysis_carterae.AAC.1